MRVTGNRGVELAIDPIGGANWTKTYSVLRPTGRIACSAFPAPQPARGLAPNSTCEARALGAVFHPLS